MQVLNRIRVRFCQLIIVLLSASFITFGLTYLSPSDPAEMLLTSKDVIPTEELLEKTREEMGLNDPFVTQYIRWLTQVVKGDLGYSYSARDSVKNVIGPRVIMTARLAITAVGILVTISLLLGILSGIFHKTWLDYFIRFISLVGISIPGFWLGMLLILLLVVKVHVFELTDPYAMKSVFLPALSLAIPLSGRYIRQIRAAVLEQYRQNYVVGAKTRGIKRIEVIFFQILPNAMLSIITLLGLSVAMLLGGTVIIERIFAWPGLGSMAIDAITYRDYALLQAYVIFMTIIYVSINFVVDILSELIDPRLRAGGDKHAEA